MKRKIQALGASLLALAFIAIVYLITSPAATFAQQPSDNSVTRPDHISLFGDLGTCNEGDTEYNIIVHFGKRCTGLNTWAPIPAVPGITPNQVYMVNASSLPAAGLIGDANATANTAVGVSLMRLCHATYNFSVDGGAVSTLTPASTCAMPANAVVVGATINSTTAVTSAGSATLAIGTTAGSSSTSILTATAKTSLTSNALVNATATFAAPVKLSAAGSVNVTVGTAAITAGVVEIYVYFYSSST